MDILYVLGTGSQWENRELMYSIRSCEKYCKGLKRIFLTGDIKPQFLNNKIIFNQVKDINKIKPVLNTLDKILWTIKNTNISENFLLMNDDFFFTKPVDIINYPFACKGELREKNNNYTTYRESEVNTKNYLKLCGIKTLNFDVHCPLIINKTEFLKLESHWIQVKNSKYGMLYRSIYCNHYNKTPFMRADCKIYDINGIDDLKRKIQPYDCFSSSDQSLSQGIVGYLFGKFTKPSSYER